MSLPRTNPVKKAPDVLVRIMCDCDCLTICPQGKLGIGGRCQIWIKLHRLKKRERKISRG